MLDCGHAFHYTCVVDAINKGWPGMYDVIIRHDFQRTSNHLRFRLLCFVQEADFSQTFERSIGSGHFIEK
jgi:hypothetical protein